MESVLSLIQHASAAFTSTIAAFIAGGAVVAWLHRRALRPTIRRLDAWGALIQAQLSVNHGGSLVDKANRVEGLEEKVDAVLTRLESIEEVIRFLHPPS